MIKETGQREERAKVGFNKLLKEGLVTQRQEQATILLIRSAYSCKKREYEDYKDRKIKFNFPNRLQMVRDIIEKLPDMWRDWQIQTEIYIKDGEKWGLRPTVDRKNPNGDYDIKNIQMKPRAENVASGAEGKKKEVSVIVFKKNETTLEKFDSRKSYKEEYGLGFDKTKNQFFSLDEQASSWVFVTEPTKDTRGKSEKIEDRKDEINRWKKRRENSNNQSDIKRYDEKINLLESDLKRLLIE